MKMFAKQLSFLTFLCIITLASIGQKANLKGLDTFLEKQMKSNNVPGMSVALVKDDKTIYEKGFGLKNTKTGEKVDSNTLFAIASNSKAYTATMLAMLVDEGEIEWDDKVQDYLPWFRMYNAYVSSEITIRDLLCHRSGLETFSGDLYWYGSKYSAEEVVQMAANLEPSFSFRSGYGYQNIMFIAAGLVIEEVTGKSWASFCKERILNPLGMKNTLTSTNDFTKSTNLAEPHNDVDGTNIPIDWVNWDNVVAAGGLISSAHEEAEWLKFNLNKGIHGQDTLINSDLLYEMWEIHNTNATNAWSRNFYEGRSLQGYGLGWQIMVYKGHRVIHHGGGYDGMISHSFFLPEAGVGGVVLTNNITSLSYFLMYDLIDRLLGEKNKEAITDKVLPFIKGQQEQEKMEREEFMASAVKNTKPTHALSDYAGTYRDEVYGDLLVVLGDDGLEFEFEPTPLFHGSLIHRHYDTFMIEWGEQMMLPMGTVLFSLDKTGNIISADVDVPNPDFDFGELHFERVKE